MLLTVELIRKADLFMRENSRTTQLLRLEPGANLAIAAPAPMGTTLEELPDLLERHRRLAGAAIKRAQDKVGFRYHTEAGWFFNRQGGAVLVLVITRPQGTEAEAPMADEFAGL